VGVADWLRPLAQQTGPVLRRLLGPFHRRRHRRALLAGAVGAEALARAREEWWGADPRWYPGGTPPRRRNRVTPLVDGAAFFAAVADELARARAYVYVVGWCLTPQMPLRRTDESLTVASRLATLLAAAGGKAPVRVLLWAGSPVLFPPSTRLVEAVARELEEAGGDVRCALDRSAAFSHCHHQKAIVVDGRVAFVGGMDLTTLGGDRWDTPAHPLRFGPNWHDVALRIEGEAVADVEHNIRQRWRAVTDDDLPHAAPVVDPAWATSVQIVRTIPPRTYRFAPDGEFGVHHAYLAAIEAARRFVYLENQYLWSPEVVDALAAVIAARRGDRFRVMLVLPARAEEGKWDNDQHVDRLRRLDGGRGVVSVYCSYASGPGSGPRGFVYRPVYVHAKAAVVDDEWFTAGSANLNGRGFVTDSELNAVGVDPTVARALRLALWAEHLRVPAAELADRDPLDVIDELWPARADANAAVLRAGDRPLPSPVYRYEVGRMPGAWLLEELEALTFEH
jgi:phosphatidylserine/phosphatidylglycerophosphate/cardiolipin synthase-like enzyme